MSDIDVINHKLVEVYGKDLGLNLPKYRVVWSEYTEKRYGEYAIYNEQGIFLREEKGVFETPKYLGLCSEKWVLEEIKSTKGNPYLEVVSPWSYEPIWVFGAANSNPKPIWRAVELLIKIRLDGDPNRVLKTASDVIDADRKKLEKEKQICKDILKNESPFIAGQLHDGDAVAISNTDFLEKAGQ